MKIAGLESGIGNIEGLKVPDKTSGSAPAVQGGSKDESFGGYLMRAVKEVDGMQQEAEKQIEGLMLNKPGVTVHGAMVALEKADITFQLMNQIKGKLVRAYEELIRTQL